MNINKLDLLSKGWKTSEVETASDIIAKAEENRRSKNSIMDNMVIAFLGGLLLINVFICSAVIVPFVYAIPTSFATIIVAIIAFVFSILFTVVIYDVEKIHPKRSTDLSIGFVIAGLINFYFIIYFAEQFGAESKLAMGHNIYFIAAVYLGVFLIPHIIYRIRGKREV